MILQYYETLLRDRDRIRAYRQRAQSAKEDGCTNELRRYWQEELDRSGRELAVFDGKIAEIECELFCEDYEQALQSPIATRDEAGRQE